MPHLCPKESGYLLLFYRKETKNSPASGGVFSWSNGQFGQLVDGDMLAAFF
jgi:hypothetical protein